MSGNVLEHNFNTQNNLLPFNRISLRMNNKTKKLMQMNEKRCPEIFFLKFPSTDKGFENSFTGLKLVLEYKKGIYWKSFDE